MNYNTTRLYEIYETEIKPLFLVMILKICQIQENDPYVFF